MKTKLRGPPIVEASYQELISFLRYCRHFGTPVIIGGWAVYFYNPYFGSVDIDVVGPSYKGGFEELIESYERSHGYEVIQEEIFGAEISASKPIMSKTGKKLGEMEIDAASYERAGTCPFHEDNSKSLPYYLCEREECRREVKIAKAAVCYVPTKALLTLFKVKARRDRSFDIRTKGATLNPSKLAWLRAKVTKDGSDIIALLDPQKRDSMLSDEIDYGQMTALASEFGLTESVADTLKAVLSDKGALSLYGRKVNTKALLKRVAGLNP